MKADILDSSASPSSREVSYREPMVPATRRVRHWRMPIALSVGMLALLASFVIAGISLHLRADHPSTARATSQTQSDDTRWYSLGYVDIEGSLTRLYPVQPGRVTRIEARENELVKAGEPLFYLDDTVPQLQVRRAKAGVKEATGQLKAAQADADALDKKIAAEQVAVETAENEVKRATVLRDEKNKLGEKDIAPTYEVEDARLLLQKAELGVRAHKLQLAALEALKRKTAGALDMARANLEDKQALLAEAEHAVKECVVRAPVDGTPLRFLVSVGETLGGNPHQPAIQFAAKRPLLVRAEIEQEFVAKVAIGQKVIIEDSVTAKQCATGRVSSIARWYAQRRTANPEMVSMNNDNRTLECIVTIDEPASSVLRIGQRVRVFPD